MARVILFFKLSQGGLTFTLQSKLACHILVSALQSSWSSLSFLRARIWPDLWVFLLLPAMHLALFLLPHSSQSRWHLLQIPASLSTSSPGTTHYDQKVQEHRKKQLWHTGWEYKFSIPITGRSFFVQTQSRTCGNPLLGIRTFTPGDRSTWHPGDAGSYPAASIFKGDQGVDSSLWSVLASSICMKHLGKVLDFLANTSQRCQNKSNCLSSIWNTLCSMKSALLKASNPTFFQNVCEAKPGFGVVPRQKQYF